MTSDGRFYQPQDRDQVPLFGHSLRQAVAEEADVLALDAVVEELDLWALETAYQRVGHPAYHPKALLRVLIYAYSIGLRSSRQVARACRMDDAFRFLSHGQAPDFRTLCRFRRQHADALGRLFAQTVMLCQQAGLVTLGHVAIDGTKLRANRSKRTLAHARKALAEALREAEEADADIPDEQMPPETSDDEECRSMKSPEGIVPAYNGQLAVDSAHQVIVAQQLLTATNDEGALALMVGQVEVNCNAPPAVVSADGGYLTREAVETLDATKSKLHMPLRRRGLERFEWLQERGAYRCPQGHLLKLHAVRNGTQIYRTHSCRRCPEAAACRVTGPLKEMHIPLPDSAMGRLSARMSSPQGQAIYAARKRIVEPVIGHLKHNLGFRRFLLRGRRGASAEWTLMCLVHNLGKLAKAWRDRPADAVAAVGARVGVRRRAVCLALSLAHLFAPPRLWAPAWPIPSAQSSD
jgi:transposase